MAERRRAATAVPSRQPAPLITAMRDGSRRVAVAADAHAVALGLHPGMAVAHARAMIADLDVRQADPAGDAAALERLASWAIRRFTPLVAVDPPDGLWLDITGASHLHGGEAALLETLVARLAASGLTARAAVAPTPGCAHAVARFGRDRIACVADAAAALGPLPVAALRLDEPALETLRRLGLDRIAAVRAVSRGPLARRLGAGVVRRLDAALGDVPEPVAWAASPTRFAAVCRLLEPIVTADAVRHVIDRLCADLCTAAAAAGIGLRVADLRLDRVDGDVVAVRAGTSRPTRDAAHLAKLFAARIETIDPGFGIESATLIAVLTEPLPPEQLGGAAPAPDLAELVDRLVSRLGRRRVYRVAPRDSDLPERSICRIAAIDARCQRVEDTGRHVGHYAGGNAAYHAGPPAAHRAGRPAARQPRAPGGGWPDYPRPVRLFDPPEYIVATAALPDHPPVRFRWRGVWHRVAAADGPERVFGEWWLADAERRSVRDYFAVEDDAGARFWLFRAGDGVDPATGSMDWYLQGLW